MYFPEVLISLQFQTENEEAKMHHVESGLYFRFLEKFFSRFTRYRLESFCVIFSHEYLIRFTDRKEYEEAKAELQKFLNENET